MSPIIVSQTQMAQYTFVYDRLYVTKSILHSFLQGSTVYINLECSFPVRTNSTSTLLHGDSRYRLQYSRYIDSHGITSYPFSWTLGFLRELLRLWSYGCISPLGFIHQSYSTLTVSRHIIVYPSGYSKSISGRCYSSVMMITLLTFNLLMSKFLPYPAPRICTIPITSALAAIF